MMILAQSEGFEGLLWVIAILVISFVSWLVGKLKEMSGKSSSPRPTARSAGKKGEDEESIVVDLAEMLGMPELKPSTPHALPRPRRPIPIAVPTRSVARPAPPAPKRIKPKPPPSEPEIVAVAIEPEDSSHVFPGDLTDTRFTPTKSASAGHRIGALTRAEMRRGIILREILDKPLALRDLPE